jgi:hypothetical protein
VNFFKKCSEFSEGPNKFFLLFPHPELNDNILNIFVLLLFLCANEIFLFAKFIVIVYYFEIVHHNVKNLCIFLSFLYISNFLYTSIIKNFSIEKYV